MQGFRFDKAFEEQVLRTPEAVALRSPEGTITYADLDVKANQIANHLKAAGVPTEAFVGLYLERSINAVAAMLGILKADAAVVPLPPSWPADRIAEVLNFADLDAVIVADSTPLPANICSRVLSLDDALRGIASAPTKTLGSDRPAFVICSSGSTGTPKMIVRSHGSFYHRLQWTWNEHPFTATDVCVQKSFQTTTHAVYELFEPMLRGVTVRIVPDEALRDLAEFWSLLASESVTRLLIVPSMLQASLDLPGFVAPPLRVMVLMGEHVSASLASRAVATFPAETKIFSIYGSSEASSTMLVDLRLSRPADEDPPVGEPISPEVRAYVLDKNLCPVAPGGFGMLYIAGKSLFTEYFRDAEGTNAVLEERYGSERLYCTNDQIHVMEDGSFVFAGRADGVVKVRGFRVDISEVERALSRVPGIMQSVVAPYPDAPSAATLIGFVTPGNAKSNEIFGSLRRHLPAYMMPSIIISKDEFPRTPNGKVDRRRLVAEYGEDTARTSNAQYASATENAVADVWRNLLQCGAIHRDGSFFEVGGTSLTVFAAAHRLREVFGLTNEQLSAAAIYAYPTLSALAAAIDRAVRGDIAVEALQDETVLVTLRQGDGSDKPPLFCISSAGGTLGAYDKVVRALRTPREVVGLRDPFLAGARDPTDGFQRWVRCYADAVRRRQPQGPYHVLAYSSAGAFGYEMAQQLRADGEEVSLLALVDPVGMDSNNPQRFGHRALWARSRRDSVRKLVRIGGQLRAAVPKALRERRNATNVNNWTPSHTDVQAMELWAKTDRENIVRFSTLLELNTGQPFAISDSELDSIEPSAYLDFLLARVTQVDASIDANLITRVLVQYDLQARAQHRYRLQRYDRSVHLFDVADPHSGLIAAQLRPYVRSLYIHSLAVDVLTDRTRELLEPFPENLRAHLGCMRNDVFAKRLATELDALLQIC